MQPLPSAVEENSSPPPSKGDRPPSATNSTTREQDEEGSTPQDEDDVPLMRILAWHCMPHAAVPRLISEHVVILFMAPPSMNVIERQTKAAHRHAADANDNADSDTLTKRNALPVTLLQLAASRSRPMGPIADVQDLLQRVCSLSHRRAALEALAVLMERSRMCELRAEALRDWCLLRLCDAEGPDTDDERRLRAEVLTHMRKDASFLVSAVARDELFLRIARRMSDATGCRREAAELALWLGIVVTCPGNVDVFATAEFFDEFFLEFAWLHRSDALCSVIRRNSVDRLRSCLTTAFRDAYFRRTMLHLSCFTFRSLAVNAPSAFGALEQCAFITAAAAERGIRFPCTETLRDFITELTTQALQPRSCLSPADLGATLCQFEVILKHCADFTALRTAVFLESFFLEVAGALGLGSAKCDESNTTGRAALIKMLASVTQHASPSEVAVFATSRARDRLIVPLGQSVHGEAYPAEVRAAFTAAFTAIARTEDGSLRAAFDTEAVRSTILPRLA